MEILDFEQARALALSAYERLHEEDKGHFIVETYGWEDDEHFNVVIGTREWLRDKNWDYLPPDDDTAILVRKDNGAIEEVNPLEVIDKMTAMWENPVGQGHPEDEDE